MSPHLFVQHKLNHVNDRVRARTLEYIAERVPSSVEQVLSRVVNNVDGQMPTHPRHVPNRIQFHLVGKFFFFEKSNKLVEFAADRLAFFVVHRLNHLTREVSQ